MWGPQTSLQSLFCVTKLGFFDSAPPPAGILLAATSIGPAFGYMMGSFMLRFYVDIDKMSKGEPNQLEHISEISLR